MKVNGVAETFLRHGDCYLLMKRSAFKQHYPNVWAGVGGGIIDIRIVAKPPCGKYGKKPACVQNILPICACGICT